MRLDRCDRMDDRRLVRDIAQVLAIQMEVGGIDPSVLVEIGKWRIAYGTSSGSEGGFDERGVRPVDLRIPIRIAGDKQLHRIIP